MTNTTTNTFLKFYLLGNEDAQADTKEGIYQLAEKCGIDRDSIEWNAYIAGGAAYRFNGHTFATPSAQIA